MRSAARAVTNKRDLVVTRIFNAPRDAVWNAWTEPDAVKRWWGPKVFTAPSVKIDLRVGGEYLYDMRSPEGKDYWSKGNFREIVFPERLVLTDSFADAEGNVVPTSYYGLSPDFPLKSQVTVTFEEYAGNKTRLTLHYFGSPETDFDSAQTGWNESFDKLSDFVGRKNLTSVSAEPGRQEISITREFDAPRNLVFKAFTDPQLYLQWVGPRRYKMILDKFEPQPGGSWRYFHEDKDGNKFGFHGVYHAVSPEMIIDTFEFEGLTERGHVSLETFKFEDLPGGRTKLTVQSVFQSAADRDGMMQGGMEWGVKESHERLDELLEKMKLG